MLLICRLQMSVTDINDNKVLYWNRKIQIVMKSYLKTLKRFKTKILKTLLRKRITITAALEAYLEPSESLMKELFCVNN